MTPRHMTLLAAIAALTVAGCSGKKEPETTSLPSQTILAEPPQQATEVRPAPPRRPPEDTLIVIEPGSEEDPNQSLIAASRAERERREKAGEPEIVLTDKNLKEYQEGAQLTYVHEPEGEAEPTTPAATEGEAASDFDPDGIPTGVGEQYWRDRGRQIRTAWRESIERIEELQGDVAEYRRRFYEEDDPSIRDTRLKPAWDRSLEELEEVRDEARQLEEDLANYLDLGYAAGALPEWLDDGIELEPARDELDELERSQSTIQFEDPKIAPEDLDDDGGFS